MQFQRPTRVLQTTFFAMLTLQAFGSIDAKHRLPAPRAFVAICVLWGLLHIMADTGMRQMAARLSLLVLTTATVVGPFGKRLLKLLDIVSKRFAIQPDKGTGAASSDDSTTPDVLNPPQLA